MYTGRVRAGTGTPTNRVQYGYGYKWSRDGYNGPGTGIMVQTTL